jgi:hypothetical protein
MLCDLLDKITLASVSARHKSSPGKITDMRKYRSGNSYGSVAPFPWPLARGP